MATASGSTIRQHSRRSTRGLSLLQDSLLEGVPTGIPADERLRILLRRCFKRALEEINDEVEPFQELHHTFLVEGLALFDDTGEDDKLTKLLKAATELAPVDKSTIDVVTKHHEQLRSLTEECERWKKLLASDMGLGLDEESVPPEAVEMPPERKSYYEAVRRKAERARRAAFQYAAAIRAMSGVRDQDDSGEAEDASGEAEDASEEADEASILDV